MSKKSWWLIFAPPRQNYSNKNHWGYWTGKKKNQGQYICDTCLINTYQNHKRTYLASITDSKKDEPFGLISVLKKGEKLSDKSKNCWWNYSCLSFFGYICEYKY
ncbi:MAG: hypothetical protein I3265_00915 [Candidatus Moeniiplasma glomeromycotorum]|nr:hypothetical protein [Candidatus Moeniiplasma glomeromycotorum]